MKPGNKIYFANLDALRFFAFFSVFLFHAWRFYLPAMHTNPFILWLKAFCQVGALGVNFFFVLSGFLITYLLFAERETTGNNSLPKFYGRRALRIWPLYFGIVLVSFYVVPVVFSLIGKPFYEPSNILYFIFFAINFQIIAGVDPYSPLLGMLWSVAVEEQFYIAWPLLFKLLFKKINWLFLFVLLISVLFRIVYYHHHKIIYFNTLSIVSDFAIGGFTAYTAFYQTKLFLFLRNLSKRQIGAIYLFIGVLLLGYNYIFHPRFMVPAERVIIGVIFAFIIFEQTFCLHSLFKAGNVKLFTHLGKISYGLYCFHSLAIIIAIHTLLKTNMIYGPFEFMVLLPALALFITILISWVSYRFYESYFLRLKKKISFQA